MSTDVLKLVEEAADNHGHLCGRLRKIPEGKVGEYAKHDFKIGAQFGQANPLTGEIQVPQKLWEQIVETLEFYGDPDKWQVLQEFDIDLEGFDLGDHQERKAAAVLKKIRARAEGKLP